MSEPLVKHIYTADPSAHVFNNKLYIYPSHDRETDIQFNDNGDQYDMNDYHVFSLETVGGPVTDHGVVLKDSDIPWVSKQLCAPDAATKNGKYYLYFPARDKEGVFRIGVAEGDKVSEAAVSRTYAMRKGVPDTAILLENDGRTTHQSLRAVAQLLAARDLDRAVVVSDGLHLFRAWTSARHHGLVVLTSPSRPGEGALPQLVRQPTYFLLETVKAPMALFVEW